VNSLDESVNELKLKFHECYESMEDVYIKARNLDNKHILVDIMNDYLEMYASELDVKQTILAALSFTLPSMELTTYLITWRVQPFLNKDKIRDIKRKLSCL